MSFTWPSKDPDEVLDYTHDWTARLDGDQIQTAEVIFETTTTVTLERPTSFVGSIQTVWLEGGTANESLKMTLRITTVDGRVFDEGIKLKIKPR